MATGHVFRSLQGVLLQESQTTIQSAPSLVPSYVNFSAVLCVFICGDEVTAATDAT